MADSMYSDVPHALEKRRAEWMAEIEALSTKENGTKLWAMIVGGKPEAGPLIVFAQPCHVTVNKQAIGFRLEVQSNLNPTHFEILLVDPPEGAEYYVKRYDSGGVVFYFFYLLRRPGERGEGLQLVLATKRELLIPMAEWGAEAE